MDASQLPDVSGLLVTSDNPANTDLQGMDHARCAALHNYIVHYAWIAEGCPPAILQSNTNTYFTVHGAAADALRPRLDSSLVAFLSTALLPPIDLPERAPFFFWANGFSDPDPDSFFDNPVADLFDEPEDSLVVLYFPNIGQGGSSGGGVYYHQGCHRAAVFMHMDDHDFALPVQQHPELWHPLETILSNWIELIHIGKITAAPRDVPAQFVGEKIGPWEWWPYSEAQVAACISAWGRLCDAIEARMSPTTITINAAEPGKLVTPAVLDAASVPDGFARAFLTRARRPQFRYIAPGLVLPSKDASEFAATQSFTRIPRDANAIPPICLFPTTSGEHVDLTVSSSPFCSNFHTGPSNSRVPSRVPAGLYSESVDRSDFESAEEGFRLLLPYCFKGGDFSEMDAWAKKSDGSVVEREMVAELFQHGYKPFGGDYYRPQRLERLFDHWCKLVEQGVWSVGPHGVEGTIETFKEADTSKCKDYVIPPTW